MTRWLVVHEYWTITAYAGLTKPLRTFHYYRWRWLAKLCAFTDQGAWPSGVIVKTKLLGRIRSRLIHDKGSIRS